MVLHGACACRFANTAVDGKTLILGYILLHKHCCNGKITKSEFHEFDGDMMIYKNNYVNKIFISVKQLHPSHWPFKITIIVYLYIF